jgi:hypothetical protein
MKMTAKMCVEHVSVLPKNGCPDNSGLTVRFQQDWVSG